MVTLTSDYNPGDWFAIGTTVVTYNATDASGNTAMCSFNVTVLGGMHKVTFSTSTSSQTNVMFFRVDHSIPEDTRIPLSFVSYNINAQSLISSLNKRARCKCHT